jgi:hypothetical protein
MVNQVKNESKSLYETDYNLWVLETVKKLENRELEVNPHRRGRNDGRGSRGHDCGVCSIGDLP